MHNNDFSNVCLHRFGSPSGRRSMGSRAASLLSTMLKFACALCIMLSLAGCRSRQVVPFPSGGGSAGDVTVILDASVSPDRKKVIEISHEWIGTPYMYAHAEKGIASDCSGMVVSVFEEAVAKKLPRNSEKQAEFCKKIREVEVKPGDLVFFATGKDPRKISHVGIMLNSEDFIHVSSSKGTCISTIRTPYYSSRLTCFGRVPDLE